MRRKAVALAESVSAASIVLRVARAYLVERLVEGRAVAEWADGRERPSVECIPARDELEHRVRVDVEAELGERTAGRVP